MEGNMKINLIILSIVLPIMAIGSVPVFAQDNPRISPIMVELEEHMQKMQETVNKISRTQDPVIKQNLMNEHFSQMQTHITMMSSMLKNKRLMGTKSQKRRMVFRLESMNNMFSSTLNQIRGHYNECVMEGKPKEETEKEEN